MNTKIKSDQKNVSIEVLLTKEQKQEIVDTAKYYNMSASSLMFMAYVQSRDRDNNTQK